MVTGREPVWRIKVSLMGVEPEIWRRLDVRSDITLATLHRIIHRSMGWTGAHIHEFLIDGTRYGAPDFAEFDDALLDDQVYRLNVLCGPGDAFHYVYDGGDDWRHRILIEEAVKAEPRQHYPRCVSGANACPPEDCGGSLGYSRMLLTLAGQASVARDGLVAWLGAGFDPCRFDLAAVNAALSQMQ